MIVGKGNITHMLFICNDCMEALTPQWPVIPCKFQIARVSKRIAVGEGRGGDVISMAYSPMCHVSDSRSLSHSEQLQQYTITKGEEPLL